ncbi:carbohydrate-binding protein [Vibrio gallaecicus]|uniref:carbohydrate-binding protein n=1 Tax=Vibrio gallaecicus TaxID=552386 RepID=UPI0010CA1402|nr:carbohydrate-binding protein [Vibrio gallaecicus]MDN3614235.1 hypothetical protein [Vibrio gallaecicus]
MSWFLSFYALSDQSWEEQVVYSIGDCVAHNGEAFVATHWNKGNEPYIGKSHWEGWVHVNSSIPQFEVDKNYHSGLVVYVNGDLYLSKWGNKGEHPETSWYWRRLATDGVLDRSTNAPGESSDPKSAEVILGTDLNRNNIKDSFELGVLDTYQNEELRRMALNVSFIYRALHELELDESINLLEEESYELFNSLFAWENCMVEIRKLHDLKDPMSLYLDSIYASLLYRFGQNEAYRDLNGEFNFSEEVLTRSNCSYYEF